MYIRFKSKLYSKHMICPDPQDFLTLPCMAWFHFILIDQTVFMIDWNINPFHQLIIPTDQLIIWMIQHNRNLIPFDWSTHHFDWYKNIPITRSIIPIYHSAWTKYPFFGSFRFFISINRNIIPNGRICISIDGHFIPIDPSIINYIILIERLFLWIISIGRVTILIDRINWSWMTYHVDWSNS